ncbi:MAG TPA: hypothetical protein DEH15_20760 [Marinilabiliales bacterium]|nr:hypothetical protein [Marinilabiliales bacterium]
MQHAIDFDEATTGALDRSKQKSRFLSGNRLFWLIKSSLVIVSKYWSKSSKRLLGFWGRW